MFTEDNGLLVGGVICVVCKMLEAMEPSFSLSLIVKLFIAILFRDKEGEGGGRREEEGGGRREEEGCNFF